MAILATPQKLHGAPSVNFRKERGMFYCKECGERVGWPTEHIFNPGSRGSCEICGEVRLCFDVRTSNLPPSNKVEMSKINAERALKRASAKSG